MLNLLRCYLSGRHEYHVDCEPGAIFLHCLHCGHRSSGWAVDARMARMAETAPVPVSVPVPVPVPVRPTATVSRFAPAPMRPVSPVPLGGRVLPFVRTVAR